MKNKTDIDLEQQEATELLNSFLKTKEQNKSIESTMTKVSKNNEQWDKKSNRGVAE